MSKDEVTAPLVRAAGEAPPAAGEPPAAPRPRWLRRLLILAILVALGWTGLLFWANGGGLARLVEAQVREASGLQLQTRGLRLTFLACARFEQLLLKDPRGQEALTLGPGGLEWRWPWSSGAPLRAWVRGGKLELNLPAWQRWKGPGSTARRPSPGGGPRLAAEGQLEVDGGPWLDLELEQLQGRIRDPSVLLDVPFKQLHGRCVLMRQDPGLQTLELDANLAGGLPVALRASGVQAGFDVRLTASRAPLERWVGFPPGSLATTRFAASLKGEGSLALDVQLRRGVPPAISGQLTTTDGSLELSGEPLLGPVTGAWDFAVDLARMQVEGPVRAASMTLWTGGLPLPLRNLEAKLEIGRFKGRLARCKATTSLGSARLGARASWGMEPGWELAVELGGGPSGWLRSASIQASALEGLRIRQLGVSLPGLELEFAGKIFPQDFDPPTWQVEEGNLHGQVRGRAVSDPGLGGLLYLDAEGGHSFDLQGGHEVFRGQLAESGRLRLWVGPQGGALKAFELAAP